MASAKRLKSLNSEERAHVEKHHNGGMAPPRPMERGDCGVGVARLKKIHGSQRIRARVQHVKSGVSALIEITREDVVRVLDEAKERFIRADAALKSFRFSYPAKSEEFEAWKQLRDEWDQRDEELQAAREDLRDFGHGKLNPSAE